MAHHGRTGGDTSGVRGATRATLAPHSPDCPDAAAGVRFIRVLRQQELPHGDCPRVIHEEPAIGEVASSACATAHERAHLPALEQPACSLVRRRDWDPAHAASRFASSSRAIARSRARPTRRVSARATNSWTSGSPAAASGPSLHERRERALPRRCRAFTEADRLDLRAAGRLRGPCGLPPSGVVPRERCASGP